MRRVSLLFAWAWATGCSGKSQEAESGDEDWTVEIPAETVAALEEINTVLEQFVADVKANAPKVQQLEEAADSRITDADLATLLSNLQALFEAEAANLEWAADSSYFELLKAYSDLPYFSSLATESKYESTRRLGRRFASWSGNIVPECTGGCNAVALSDLINESLSREPKAQATIAVVVALLKDAGFKCADKVLSTGGENTSESFISAMRCVGDVFDLLFETQPTDKKQEQIADPVQTMVIVAAGLRAIERVSQAARAWFGQCRSWYAENCQRPCPSGQADWRICASLNADAPMTYCCPSESCFGSSCKRSCGTSGNECWIYEACMPSGECGECASSEGCGGYGCCPTGQLCLAAADGTSWPTCGCRSGGERRLGACAMPDSCNANTTCEPDSGETIDNCTDCACDLDQWCEPENGETTELCSDCACDFDDVCDGDEFGTWCSDCPCDWDGDCEAGEDADNCHNDCHCGDGICGSPSALEDHSNCGQDCYCGDGVCEIYSGYENASLCLEDCGCEAANRSYDKPCSGYPWGFDNCSCDDDCAFSSDCCPDACAVCGHGCP